MIRYVVGWIGRGTSIKLQREHEKKKKKKRNNHTKHIPAKYRRRALDRESLVPAASHPIPSPDRNHAPKRIASTTPYFQGFRFLYRHSQRRLGSPWVGPIKAALKRLKLATVIPGATSTLSTSSSAGVRTLFPVPSPTRL